MLSAQASASCGLLLAVIGTGPSDRALFQPIDRSWAACLTPYWAGASLTQLGSCFSLAVSVLGRRDHQGRAATRQANDLMGGKFAGKHAWRKT
jgi:hypothetical protein